MTGTEISQSHARPAAGVRMCQDSPTGLEKSRSQHQQKTSASFLSITLQDVSVFTLNEKLHLLIIITYSDGEHFIIIMKTLAEKILNFYIH